ncbi:2-amino-4-hydroxy-6-hydroxymethyldihydropteridine diphosphokinase [Aeromonas salmonicida]|uniref:2-amino-4-hydroxy-6-hydroxymethyldihydropteridine diphosphokinase n=1 Tax=Escherichia coli TaxID=562 RepID=A0A3L0W085_ECOLX|nr:2-amino-4-hydroxy-6-hydroxymethyldihydropteridine diphosphokinase [Aeromonas salmonicida]MDR6994810.1 2-amino-4-hydroxy-6-hydroxymethyldihydropteridine diphosphokinase [Aeromonas salmonicida]MDR7021607.1 2-amino-4-hydroxy-6-hydroxymethyldihydropteridine diphosphokinase [Aeromonas salmonicida]
MFYLCSIGSNLDPHIHVSQVVGELLEHFGRLQLSSVIQTKPVGMHSRHDFLNCLFVAESGLTTQQLKTLFITMELAHGRDRSDPNCKVLDRPLDIDILASSAADDFAATRVDAYLNELLAELYGQGEVHDRKVTLPLHTRLMKGKVIEELQVGLTPLRLSQGSDDRQAAAAIYPDAGPRHVVVPHQ